MIFYIALQHKAPLKMGRVALGDFLNYIQPFYLKSFSIESLFSGTQEIP